MASKRASRTGPPDGRAPQRKPAAGQYRPARESGDAARLEELDLFRSDVNSFIRAYDFLSQIINYHDTALEKRSTFLSSARTTDQRRGPEPLGGRELGAADPLQPAAGGALRG